MNGDRQSHMEQHRDDDALVEATIAVPKRDGDGKQEKLPPKTVLQQIRELGIDRKIELLFAFVGLIFAGVLAWVALGQLGAMKEQTTSMQAQLDEMKSGSIETQKLVAATEKIAEATKDSVAQSKAALDATVETSRIGQRAWVTAKNIESVKVIDGSGKQVDEWHFRAMWENIGPTPTSGARAHVSWQTSQTALSKDFRFSDLGPSFNHLFDLGPRSTIGSGLMKVDADTIKKVQDRRIHLYFYGWITYRDVFENTKLHITKFCRELSDIQGDPLRVTGNVRMIFSVCPYHNCADDECGRKNRS